ncbi:bifunctional Oxidoreductase FAD-NAD(P)-binding/Ferredoxin--NADP reductase/FAD-binding domain [Babesia duncani]|uniref:ferredoxin--NADP(+) reductase n=1 Tax=Babesia duncani TaxID=323732 RepID=A0AAD9UQ79_9APIC|nr:bifunctional Oxidoreductase FAD-NAD(P)-binding/Ferredoxin--NADP reductase/FAD-binding domain [Babesia duncani]
MTTLWVVLLIGTCRTLCFSLTKTHNPRNSVLGSVPQKSIQHCYRTKSPLIAKVHSVSKLGSNGFDRSFYHIVVDHGGRFKYSAGQYCGVIPPGMRQDINRPHHCRSYTMTALRPQDCIDPQNGFALCVRTPYMENYDTCVDDNANKSICSRYLVSVKPGDEIKILGPFTGKLLLSDYDLSGKSNIIMVATGAGIAPFMAHLQILLGENENCNGDDAGKIILIFGVQGDDTFLYRNELEKYQSQFPNRFELIKAYSQHPVPSERAYVQVWKFTKY